MEFQIKRCSLPDFLTSIREIEKQTRPFNRALYETGMKEQNNISWSKLDWNCQRDGKPIFSVQKKSDVKYPTSDPRNRIPVGNYYIEFYYYRASGQQLVGCIDLKWNENGELTKSGNHPLFCFEKTFTMLKERGGKQLPLYTIEEVLRMAVKDRLKQICAKKAALPEATLLAETINYVFKFSEDFIGNKENYRTKIANRVVMISKSNNKSGTWAFDWYQNPKGNFSDALNSSESINIDGLTEMVDYFESIGSGLVLGEASEEGGRKGNLVFLNKELQELRRPGQKIYQANYQDIMYGEAPGQDGAVYSIYSSAGKFFARVKSFLTSDGCLGDDIESFKVDEEENKLFDRHRNYLVNDPAKHGQIDPGTINMLVAYVSTEQKATEMDQDTFRDTDKAKYSRLLNMTDCHLPISETAAETVVRVRRKITEPITEKHLSQEFKQVIAQLKEEGTCKVPADMVIGYRVNCELEHCQSIMTPVVGTKNDEGEIEVQEIHADRDVNEWYCDVCGHYMRAESKQVRLSNKFQSAEAIEIKAVELDDVESSVAIDAEIICPIATARAISVEGVKGLTLPMKQDHVGYLYGEIFNPNTCNMEEIRHMPVDMLIPLGSMKGKLSGAAVSHIRMLNALTGSSICPDQMYRETGSIDQVNELLNNCKKVKLHRRNYNPETEQFDWVEEEVHVGVVSINVTEIGDEFLKVKTDVDDMKVSYMNTLFYDWLGLHSLNHSMMKASLVDIDEAHNKEFALELMRMFYCDPDGLPEVTKADFDNKEGAINIISWLEKGEWTKALENHPLLKAGSKFENGAYYTDPRGNVIVFPSRNAILNLVDIMNGNRVRLHGIVKDAFRIFLDCFKPGYTRKLQSYKENIYKKLTGKQGVLARSATFVNFGCSGKEVGSGFLPPGVAVIGNKQFWNMVREQTGKEEYDAINRGEKDLYGTSQRDPFIWAFQALNSIQLWTVRRANQYFRDTYGINFSDVYHNFSGIMLNTLDMLYLYQTDADGDLRRVLVPFNERAQLELADLNNKMQNYDLICKSDPDSAIGKMFRRVEKWHFDYVLDEAESSAEDFGDRLQIVVKLFKPADRNKMIIRSIKAKGNIGIITTSQWKLQALCDYLVKTEKPLILDPAKEPMPLTEDMRNSICLFYQTVFTQDGCVRSLKGTKDLGKCSLDELANNGETTWDDPETLQPITASVREMVREEAELAGYGDIVDPLFAVCDYWMIIGGITMREDGTVGPDLELITPEAEMLNAYISVCNGSKFMSIDKFRMFERLVEKGSDPLLEKQLIWSLIPYLEKIKERKDSEE